MINRKSHGSQRLAAACWHGQFEKARLLRGFLHARLERLGALAVDVAGWVLELTQVSIQLIIQGGWTCPGLVEG